MDNNEYERSASDQDFKRGLQLESVGKLKEARVFYLNALNASGHLKAVVRLGFMMLADRCDPDTKQQVFDRLKFIHESFDCDKIDAYICDREAIYYCWVEYLVGLMYERGFCAVGNCNEARCAYARAIILAKKLSVESILRAANLRDARIRLDEIINRPSHYKPYNYWDFIKSCKTDVAVWNLATSFDQGLNGYPKVTEMARELFDHIAQGIEPPYTKTAELKTKAIKKLTADGSHFVQRYLRSSYPDNDNPEDYYASPEELGQQYPNEGY